MQWAQNQSHVAVAVRFSPKKHGPVSVSRIERPEVIFSSTHLSFTGQGTSVNGGKRLSFDLQISLAHAILPEQSSHKLAGTGGRMTMLLTKANASAERWELLHQQDHKSVDVERRGHISTWFEMQQQFDEADEQASKTKSAKEEEEEDDSTAKGNTVGHSMPSKARAKSAKKSVKSKERVDGMENPKGTSESNASFDRMKNLKRQFVNGLNIAKVGLLRWWKRTTKPWLRSIPMTEQTLLLIAAVSTCACMGVAFLAVAVRAGRAGS